MKTPADKSNSGDEPIRPHVFDGIQEYDKKLPNWWLMTFYGAIIFSVGYWFYYAQSGLARTDAAEVDLQMARIEAEKLASVATLDDPRLWQMSRNANFVEAGRSTFMTTCASCHLASLRGKSESEFAVGPDLTDEVWLHGGRPTEINHTIAEGVLAKGMPAWGPVLGQKRVSELVAFVLSHHKEPGGAPPPGGSPP